MPCSCGSTVRSRCRAEQQQRPSKHDVICVAGSHGCLFGSWCLGKAHPSWHNSCGARRARSTAEQIPASLPAISSRQPLGPSGLPGHGGELLAGIGLPVAALQFVPIVVGDWKLTGGLLAQAPVQDSADSTIGLRASCRVANYRGWFSVEVPRLVGNPVDAVQPLTIIATQSEWYVFGGAFLQLQSVG